LFDVPPLPLESQPFELEHASARAQDETAAQESR
jgi:hypothetical protein